MVLVLQRLASVKAVSWPQEFQRRSISPSDSFSSLGITMALSNLKGIPLMATCLSESLSRNHVNDCHEPLVFKCKGKRHWSSLKF